MKCLPDIPLFHMSCLVYHPQEIYNPVLQTYGSITPRSLESKHFNNVFNLPDKHDSPTPRFVEYNINYNDQLPFPVRSWTWDVVPVCAGPFISG